MSTNAMHTDGAVLARCGAIAATTATTGILMHTTHSAYLPTVAAISHILAAGLILIPATISGAHHRAYKIYRSAMLAAAGAWCIACGFAAPWSPVMGVTAVGMIITAAAVTPPLYRMEPKTGPGALVRALSTRESKWRQILETRARLRDADISIQDWENGHGYDVNIELPQGGTTADGIESACRWYAQDLKLPHGCAVTADSGEHQGSVKLHVNTKNALKTIYHYPRELITQPASHFEPAPVGVLATGEQITVGDLRQKSVLLVGKTGSGKTVTLHNLLAHYIRCTDQLTYVIDLKGGDSVQAIMQPYYDGQISRPPIDGVGDTPERAQLLTAWLREALIHRVSAYRRVRLDSGQSLMPLSPQIPAIRIVVDEPKMIWSDYQLRSTIGEDLKSIQETARNAGGRIDLTALSGKNEEVPSSMQKEMDHTIALKVADKTELRYVMPGEQHLSVDNLRERGMAYVQLDERPVQLMRSYYATTPIMREIAIHSAGILPRIDEAMTQVPSYAQVADRWDWRPPGESTPGQPQNSVEREKITVASTPAQGDTNMNPDDDMGAAMQRLADHNKKLKEWMPEASARATDKSEDDIFHELTSGLKRVSIGDAAAVEYLGKNGRSRYADVLQAIMDSESVSRATAARRLKSLVDKGEVVKHDDGTYTAANG